MSTYVIGDIHGCYGSLRALLERLPICYSRDRLWLTGDLVNRGCQSLAVLSWAHDVAERMGERFATVLGNHDLLLLAYAEGRAALRPGDTLTGLPEAAEADTLLRWLRERPLLVEDSGTERRPILLVHAGLLPRWSVDDAVECANAVERRLRAADGLALAFPGEQDEQDVAFRDARDALAAFTRLRMCDQRGRPQRFSGPPEEAPKGLYPWYAAPGRRNREALVLFGHWAAQGYRRLDRDGAVALDSGCVWGGGLSAIRLEDGEHFHVPTEGGDVV